jgi:hypothetical protein
MVAERLIGILSDDVILMTDEANFHLSGGVYKYNFRYLAEENPQWLHQRPLHGARVTVLCGMSDFGVVGPYDGRAVKSHLLVVLKRHGTSSQKN